MLEFLQREWNYLFYYLGIQLRQLSPYLALGIVLGSAISVFAKDYIHKLAEKLGKKVLSLIGIILASLLGIASPLCMYGTIPIAAAFSRKGVKDDFLAAFMMSSILLNPQLIIYSAALGKKVLLIRIFICFLCGILAGLFVKFFYCNGKTFFDFSKFNESENRDVDPNLFFRFLKNILRNIKATAPWFFVGIVLSAVFMRYIPQQIITSVFGAKNRGFGVLMAATLGVPLYVCGGGTIPIIQDWLLRGMSIGSACSFMIIGPATTIRNLGALKIALGFKHFLFYLLYSVLFSLTTGFLVDLFV